MLSQNHISPVNDDVGDTNTLQRLILLAKQGDATAFEALYTQYYTPVFRYVVSRCKDRELSEDICQQTFLKFYTALSTYELRISPLSFLFTIAKRLMINHHEKQAAVLVDQDILDSFTDDSVPVLDEIHTKQLAEALEKYIPELTSDEQEVVRLYFYGERSHKEIADILEREEVYIRKIKERALKKLRVLAQHMYEEKH